MAKCGTVPAWVDLPRLARTRPIPGWERWAACRGQPREIFFTSKNKPPNDVRELCERCPARYSCLVDTLRLEHGRFRAGHFAATTHRQRNAIAAALNPQPERHGTRGRYVGGCHCDPCTAANTRYQNRWKAS